MSAADICDEVPPARSVAIPPSPTELEDLELEDEDWRRAPKLATDDVRRVPELADDDVHRAPDLAGGDFRSSNSGAFSDIRSCLCLFAL